MTIQNNEIMAQFMKKFDKFKNRTGSKNKTEARCFNCKKPGHFAANCQQPKREQLKAAETEVVKVVEPKEQKALFAAEERSSWTESDSDDEEETINSFLANTVEEAFDDGSDCLSREELSAALKDMVFKCKRLSEKLLDVQAENIILKRHAETHEAEPKVSVSSVSEINILKEENKRLSETIFEKDRLIQKLNATVSAWTSSGTALKSIISEQRPAYCRFGLGFSGTGAESSKTDGAAKAGKPIQFVKSTCRDTFTEGMSLDKKTEPKMVSVENMKPEGSSWIKPKVRAARCSEPKRKPAVSKQKGLKFYGKRKTVLFGKRVRIIKMWIPKGIIHHGPN